MDDLTLERWKQVDALFDEALQRDPGDRTAFLRAACGHDVELYRAVEQLLTTATEAEAVLGDSAGDFAGQLVSGLAEIIDRRDDLAPGKRIGPYRISRLLGKGGMGNVYLADRADGIYEKRVAVKVVKRGMDTDEVVQRFFAERQLLAGLEHPNIAQLLDGGVTDDGRPYFVMEYVDGKPIDTYCDGRRLDVRDRLRLFQAVCSAVSYAHRNLVIHRDIKPSNILVTPEGNVKLLDFGIARLLAGAPSEWTATGTRLMTPAYASPEQLRGRAVTTSTDVYQLGVLLYVLLVGERPGRSGFDGADDSHFAPPSEAVRRQGPDAGAASQIIATHRSCASTAQLVRLLRGDLDVIAAQALHPDVERRYASVQEMSDDVRRFLAGRPIHAHPDSIGYRTRKFVRRHSTAVVAATGVLLMLMGLIAYHVTRLADERNLAQTEARRAHATMAFLENLFEGADPEVTLGDTMNVFDLLQRGRRELEAIEDVPMASAPTRLVLGRLYYKLGQFEPAQELLAQAVATFRGLGPSYQTDAAAAAFALGDVLLRIGDHESADASYREAISLRRERSDDPSTLAGSLIAYGIALEQMGRYADARTSIDEALRLIETETSDSDVLRADGAYALATVVMNEASYDEAEHLMLDALETYRTRRDISPSRLADALNNLGNLYYDVSDYDAAEMLLGESIEIRRRLFGEDHPVLSESYNNLALVPYARGNYAAADSLLRLSLSLVEAAAGRSNRSYGMTLNNLGWVQMQDGDVESATETFLDALGIMEQASGEESADAALLLGNVGTALRQQGRLREAETYLKRALEVRLIVHGEVNMHVAWRMYALAELLREDGRLLEALDLHRESVLIRRSERGNDHFDTGRGLVALGETLTESGALEEAGAVLQEAVAILSSAVGEAHPETQRAMASLARLNQIPD